MTPHRARLLSLPTCALLAFALLLLPAAPAVAGGDDFEYGRALSDLGTKSGDRAYFEMARRVYESVLKDPNRSSADKDEIRYGLATMKRDEAVGATANPAVPYKKVAALFTEAVTVMEDFVTRNPDHARAPEARLAVGTTRLGFVQWARDYLLPDAEYMGERGTNAAEVQTAAEGMVRGAIKYFDGLRKGHDKIDATELSQLSQYYWVLCQYYLALVYEPGSTQAREAFGEASKHLDEFITLNDGTLLAIYAQDIYGLTCWELAKIAPNDEEKVTWYRRAIEWFETCIETPNEGPEWERVITNGYFHLGQACLEAGRLGNENFHRTGADFLEHMEDRNPTAWRTDNGIRALIEWSKIEYARDRTSEAVAICQRAGEYAKKLGKSYLEAAVNRQLRKMLSGGSTGSVSADPEVLKRVADDFYNEGKWGEAISAYQKVVAATQRSRETAEPFLIPVWERIAAAYKAQGDLLAAALAYEPVHEIWIDGLVKKTGAPDDPNMIRLGDIRRRALSAWKDLYDLTGSETFRRAFTDIRDSFAGDYPEHPSGKVTEWNTAREQFGEAGKLKAAKDPKWRRLLKSAEEGFTAVSKDMKSQVQDAAYVYLIRIAYERDDWKGMLKRADEALTFWGSPTAKEQARLAPTLTAGRKEEIGKAIYWKAEAIYQLSEEARKRSDEATATRHYDELIKLLDGYHVEYAKLKDTRPYFEGTYGHLVMSYIGKGDIQGADKYYRRLLNDYTSYPYLPRITFQLADYYNAKARVIDAKRKVARVKLNGSKEDPLGGAKTKLRLTASQENRTGGYLGDQRAARDKFTQLVEEYEKKKAEGVDSGIPEEDYKEAQKRIPELGKEIAELTEKVNGLRAQREALEKEVQELDQEIRDLAQQLYEPVVAAAGYFKDWDDALIRSGQERIAKNVEIFADLFFKAGLLRPDVPANWESSRELYEGLLKLPDAEKAAKRDALGRLGTIYARLAAAAAAGSPERATLVKKALDRLQSSVADLRDNNDLVVGMLAGDVVVIPWQRQPGEPLYRFPLPRIKTVEEFKKAVSDLGKSTGMQLPVFATELENKRYENAVGFFKQYVTEVMKPNELARTVKGFEIAGFDVALFSQLADASEEFRLALAWIYAESGEFEHMNKAINLAGSLVAGRFGAEENSAPWWEAQVIRMRALITGAELRLKAGTGVPDPTAVDWTDRASKMMLGLTTSNPDLGDDTRPETRGDFKRLLARLESLRERTGGKPLNLILEPPVDRAPPGGG